MISPLSLFLSVRTQLSIHRSQPLWDFWPSSEGDERPPCKHRRTQWGRCGGICHHWCDLHALCLPLLSQLPVCICPYWWCLLDSPLHGRCHKPCPRQQPHVKWWSPWQQHHEWPACYGQRHKQQTKEDRVRRKGQQKQCAGMQHLLWWERAAVQRKWTWGKQAAENTGRKPQLQSRPPCFCLRSNIFVIKGGI